GGGRERGGGGERAGGRERGGQRERAGRRERGRKRGRVRGRRGRQRRLERHQGRRPRLRGTKIAGGYVAVCRGDDTEFGEEVEGGAAGARGQRGVLGRPRGGTVGGSPVGAGREGGGRERAVGAEGADEQVAGLRGHPGRRRCRRRAGASSARLLVERAAGRDARELARARLAIPDDSPEIDGNGRGRGECGDPVRPADQ